jgi:hypothetical protein
MICCGIFWEVLYVETLGAMQTLVPQMAGVLTGLFYTVLAAGLVGGALLLGELMDLVGTSAGLAIAAGAMGIWALWRLARPAPVPATR